VLASFNSVVDTVVEGFSGDNIFSAAKFVFLDTFSLTKLGSISTADIAAQWVEAFWAVSCWGNARLGVAFFGLSVVVITFWATFFNSLSAESVKTEYWITPVVFITDDTSIFRGVWKTFLFNIAPELCWEIAAKFNLGAGTGNWTEEESVWFITASFSVIIFVSLVVLADISFTVNFTLANVLGWIECATSIVRETNICEWAIVVWCCAAFSLALPDISIIIARN
jgi:hypothetical protein